MTFDFLAELNKIAKQTQGFLKGFENTAKQTHAEREAERLKKWQRDYYLAGLEKQKREKNK